MTSYRTKRDGAHVTPINPQTVDDIYERMRRDSAFRALEISRLVPGEGGGNPPLAFIVGEAPGAQESLKLRPFVGKSGAVQRGLMVSAQLYASYTPEVPKGRMVNCWLTNVVKFRPPGNRRPTQQEIDAARPYLIQEWLAVGGPQVIVAVGGVALTCVLGRAASVLKHAGTRMHGRVELDVGNDITFSRRLFLFPMLHPAFGLRTPEARPAMEKHWHQLREWLWQ